MKTIKLEFETIKNEEYTQASNSTDGFIMETYEECGRVLFDSQNNTVKYGCSICEKCFDVTDALIEHSASCKAEFNINNDIPCKNEPIVDDEDIQSETDNNVYQSSLFQMEDEFSNSRSDHEVDAADHHPTEESKYKCQRCSKSFRTEKFLYFHMALHNEHGGGYKCMHCEQTFKQKRYLQTHLAYHFSDKSFPCEVCGKDNRTNSALKTHMLMHYQKKQFVCETCGSSFSLRHHLKTHQMYKHENMRDFKCNACVKAFKTNTALKIHQKSHEKVRQFVCFICDTGFVWQKNLVEHIKLHSDEKTHKCNFCSKAFAQKSGLLNHLKSHTNLKN